MKPKRIFLIILLICSSFTMVAQESILNEISDMDGVTTVYLSKAMLGSMKGNKFGSINIGDIAGKLNSLEIISCNNNTVIKKIRKETEVFKDASKYEQLIKIKEDGSNIVIYRKSKGKIATIIMLIDNVNEYVIISMTGEISLQEIQNLTKKKK